jgi:hypothetical protein
MRPKPPVLAGLPIKEKFPCRNGLTSSGFKLCRKNQTTARGKLMLESLYQDISRGGTVDPRCTAPRLDEQAAQRKHRAIPRAAIQSPEPKRFTECELEAEFFLPCNCGFVPSWTWGERLGCARVEVRRLISGTLPLDSNLGSRNGPFLVVDSRELLRSPA